MGNCLLIFFWLVFRLRGDMSFHSIQIKCGGPNRMETSQEAVAWLAFCRTTQQISSTSEKHEFSFGILEANINHLKGAECCWMFKRCDSHKDWTNQKKAQNNNDTACQSAREEGGILLVGTREQIKCYIAPIAVIASFPFGSFGPHVNGAASRHAEPFGYGSAHVSNTGSVADLRPFEA